MSFYVYRLTCTHPDSVARYYYGVRTCRGRPEEDSTYWSRSRVVAHARITLGPLCFHKKIVSVHATREEALAKEIRLHRYFDVRTHPLFFNRANQTSTRFTPGPLSPDSRAKISQALLGNQHTRGKAHSQETRRKISEAMKNKFPARGRLVSTATREKLSHARGSYAPFQGKTHTAVTRAKISHALQGRQRQHSLETRHKISQALKARHAARRVRDQAASGTPDALPHE